MGPTFYDMTGDWPKKDDLCSVCGRPSHPCDDPECMPWNKPLAERLQWALEERRKLQTERDEFAEAFYLLWISSDRDEWDGNAVKRFDALMDKAIAYEEARLKTPNVEFSGGAPLHGAASAGTQGSAAQEPSSGD